MQDGDFSKQVMTMAATEEGDLGKLFHQTDINRMNHYQSSLAESYESWT